LEFNKKKYTQKEVYEILNAYKKEYESRFLEMRSRITDLLKENSQLKAELESNLGKDELILAVLKRAEQTALDLQKQSQLEYELEIERLNGFSKKWDSYFNKIKAKYPTSTQVKKAIKINEKVKNVKTDKSAKETCLELEKMIDGEKKDKKPFNPKKKMADYISATEDGGFSMDEVLNPGKLELEALCKELGLLDGNE